MSQRVAELSHRVTADPWDADAWAALCAEAAAALPYRDAAPHLARAAARFPTSPAVWTAYLDAAASPAAQLPPQDVHDVLQLAVRSAPTAHDLWRRYAAWAEANPALADPTAVYEDALKAAGLDLTAHPLWADYIDFVKRADLPESNKRDSLRKIYQRAVRNPMQDVDKFWQMYRNFEETTNANKDLGRGLIAEVQPRHVAARAEFRARRTRREGLALAVLPVPPRGRPKEASQAAQWRRFIAAERANPHGLDAQSLHARVVHAYETALVPLYRYPDIWIDYASYVADIASGRAMVPNLPSSGGKSGSGGGSMQAVPGSSAGQGAGGGLGTSGANGGAGSQGGSGDGSGTGGDNPANVSEFESVAERAVRALSECVAVSHHISWLWMRFGRSANALSTLDALVKASPSPLAYVHLMRLTRKVSGTGAARKVFAKARRDPLAADPAVFIAAAQMEFIVNKDNKVARNVFEFGLKHFGNNALMIREFVEWLWGLGDFDHLRVVLKRVMPSIEGPPEIVRKLWERWIELEEAVGDVTTVESVENQWRESGTCHTPTAVADALRRSRFLGLEGMREEELVIAGSTASVTGIAGGGAVGGGIISGGGAGGAGGSSGGAGGGRRDPRTGRRVGGGSTHTGAGASGGSGSDAHGSGANGSATGVGGGGGSGARNISTAGGGSAMLMPGNSFEEIEANLRRMGAQMQHINAPPPDYETIVQLVMKTPDLFSATPAFSALSANGVPAGLGGTGPSGAPGKKRTNEDMLSNTAPAAVMQAQQRPDLFRSRQAAKQSRMR